MMKAISVTKKEDKIRVFIDNKNNSKKYINIHLIVCNVDGKNEGGRIFIENGGLNTTYIPGDNCALGKVKPFARVPRPLWKKFKREINKFKGRIGENVNT